MYHFWQYFTETFCLALAIITGLLKYRLIDRTSRYVLLQLLTWGMFYIMSYAVTNYQKSHQMTPNNHWVFNLYLVLEGVLLMLAARSAMRRTVMARIALLLLLAFAAGYSLLMMYNGLENFNRFVFLLESFCVTGAWLLVLSESLRIENRVILRGERLFAIGLLVYFGCNVPYFAFFDYLNREHPQLSATLFHTITDVCVNVRYLLCAAGFLVAARGMSPVLSRQNG